MIDRIEWEFYKDTTLIAKGKNFSSYIPEIKIKKRDQFVSLNLKLNYASNNVKVFISKKMSCYCIKGDDKIDFNYEYSGQSNSAMRIERNIIKNWAEKCKNKMLWIYSDDNYPNGLTFQVILK